MSKMHILHYLYGIPPYRGGGMIKYALDLIEAEENMGYKVSLLYPGSIYKRNSSHIKIKKEASHQRTDCYRIQNPLPIPLGSGIKDFEWYMSEAGFQVYIKFLKNVKPDVIHVHSLMGIHESFFRAAKQLKIRIVYTSHDYFGLCPVMTLMKEDQNCTEKDWGKCSVCCRNAFSTTHLILDQAAVVQRILQTTAGKRILDLLTQFKALVILKRETESVQSVSDTQSKDVVYTEIPEYQKLERHYKNIFEKIDFYHFNSEISKIEFMKRIGDVKHCVIPITNSSCTDRRRKRNYGSTLQIGFLGGNNVFKGFSILYDSVRELYQEGCDVILNTYFGTVSSKEEFWQQHQPYSDSEMEAVMNENDVILVPSIWKETFGLVVMEALSYGVPVIVSEHVGARILLEGKEEMGKILHGDLRSEIKKCLRELSVNKSILERWNDNICKAELEFSMEKHGKKIVDICYEEEYEKK